MSEHDERARCYALAERILLIGKALRDTEICGDDANEVRAAYRALKSTVDFSSAAHLAEASLAADVLQRELANLRNPASRRCGDGLQTHGGCFLTRGHGGAHTSHSNGCEAIWNPAADCDMGCGPSEED